MFELIPYSTPVTFHSVGMYRILFIPFFKLIGICHYFRQRKNTYFILFTTCFFIRHLNNSSTRFPSKQEKTCIQISLPFPL